MVRRAWVLMLGFALLVTTVTHAEFEECESSTDPMSEPAGASALPVYGKTVPIELQ